MKISHIREEYKKSRIDFTNSPNHPIEMFRDWFSQALKVDQDDAICMVLSTVSTNYMISSRVVLLRGIDEEGFTFFTNYESKKSRDILNQRNVSLVFFWRELEKQVRVSGKAFQVPTLVSDNYFSSRPHKSKVSACISNQSDIIPFDFNFDQIMQDYIKSNEGKEEVKRPDNWGGYKVIPESIEFWQGKPSRLHDRLLYTRKGDVWEKVRLSP